MKTYAKTHWSEGSESARTVLPTPAGPTYSEKVPAPLAEDADRAPSPVGSPPAQHAHRGAVSEAPEEPEGPGAVTSQSVHTAVHGRRHRNKTAEDATGEGLKNLSLSRKQREAREAFYPEKQTAGSLGRIHAVALGPPPRPGCTRPPPPSPPPPSPLPGRPEETAFRAQRS